MDIDGDIGVDSYSSVDDEVPRCDTSFSSSLMSIADSESEYSDLFDYDDEVKRDPARCARLVILSVVRPQTQAGVTYANELY